LKSKRDRKGKPITEVGEVLDDLPMLELRRPSILQITGKPKSGRIQLIRKPLLNTIVFGGGGSYHRQEVAKFTQP